LPNGKAQLALMESCLANTTKALNRLLGTDPTQWQWGKLHQVTFAHALGVQAPFNNIFSVGAFPVGGDTNTVAQTGIHINQPYHNNAISVSSRHIVHMANLSETQMIHAPGQSGHLGSPHYDDMVPFWLGKGYITMAWDETAVSSAAQHILTLKPMS
ncbi:MAG: penicillin acylase family protein, partial [Chloroflexi bacterium]|nr:penicillin acylase family protein [Chloroflexota bacterium]